MVRFHATLAQQARKKRLCGPQRAPQTRRHQESVNRYCTRTTAGDEAGWASPKTKAHARLVWRAGLTYLPEAGVNGTDEDSEGLPGAAPHGAEHFAEEGDEAQPALDVALLQLVPPGEVLLQREGQAAEGHQGQGRLIRGETNGGSREGEDALAPSE